MIVDLNENLGEPLCDMVYNDDDTIIFIQFCDQKI